MKPLRAIIIVIFSLSLALIPYGPARANIFDDFEGMVTDPLKLGHLSDRLQQTVLDALAQLQQLLGRANDIAKQRLDQIQAAPALPLADTGQAPAEPKMKKHGGRQLAFKL